MLRVAIARAQVMESRVRISPQQHMKWLSVETGQCWPTSIEVRSGAKVRISA